MSLREKKNGAKGVYGKDVFVDISMLVYDVRRAVNKSKEKVLNMRETVKQTVLEW